VDRFAPAAAMSCALLTATLGCAVLPLGGARAQAPAANAPFDACAACHSVDGSNGTGPTLKGIIGRQSGTVPGFRYSRAMKSAAITWDEASLDRYLTNPQELVPGNIMPFSGVADGRARADLIAYLRTLR
jgi:cytochrome c